jgi:ribulose 1,5-bisphosphate synthetase/thiazole synthase
MGGGRRPDLSQMLERLPKIAVTDLKPGDTIVVASTVGANPAALTAITLLANADFLIAMQQRRQQESRGQGTGPGMGNWNLGDMSMIPMQ